MLTRCPACATHFRVTPEQLKARSGRVRCGECQQVFNALDALIEEPMSVLAPRAAKSAQWTPSEAPEPVAEIPGVESTWEIGEREAPAPEPDQPAQPEDAGAELAELEAVEPVAVLPEAALPEAELPETAPPEAVQPAMAEETDADAGDWTETFPEPPPPPRRWPWVIGSLVALAALGLQAVLAFRVELAVLWPEARPALVALCSVADCEVGLPAKVALVGIEASDLYPDSEHPGRLALTATIKSRAPFAQRFPHLELTLTDTADKAVARKVLAPADYLPPQTPLAEGMPPNADITIAIGVDSSEAAASGYRLYVFYP